MSELSTLAKSFDLIGLVNEINKLIKPLMDQLDTQQESNAGKIQVLHLIKSLYKSQQAFAQLNAVLTNDQVSSHQLQIAVRNTVIAQQVLVRLIRKINFATYLDDDQYAQLSEIMVDQTISESLFVFIYAYTGIGSSADQSAETGGGANG